RQRMGKPVDHLMVKRGKFATLLHRRTGWIVQQRNLKHPRHHQGFMLVEAQQMMAINLRDLHNIY
ncbi:MAG: hypothetical protein ACO289_11705, partial [Prochlorococcaceae cyanobacterium]